MAGADFAEEINYWDRELSLQGTYPEAILRRATPERMTEEFPHYLAPYFDELRAVAAPHKPKVLDVGSGPLSMLAFGHRTGMFELTCVDPLADDYHALLAKHGRSPNSLLMRGFGEDLDALFPEAAFDLIWMHNALDHSQSPERVLQALARTVRRGGYLVLQGWRLEGTFEGWIGLHQHDLFLAGGRLMCRTQTGPDICVSDGLPLEAVEILDESDKPRGWMRVIYRKTI